MTTELGAVNATEFIEDLIRKGEILTLPGSLVKYRHGDIVFLGKGQLQGYTYGYEHGNCVSLMSKRWSSKGMHSVSVGAFPVFYGGSSVMANNHTGLTEHKFMVLKKEGNEFGIALLIPTIRRD